ncbi:hypothetical protein HN510_03030 [Candidatus Woesearchaeota archaeon]|nr:hypothetical protein [Candidatus Woesearchaeota archaeon]
MKRENRIELRLEHKEATRAILEDIGKGLELVIETKEDSPSNLKVLNIEGRGNKIKKYFFVKGQLPEKIIQEVLTKGYSDMYYTDLIRENE